MPTDVLKVLGQSAPAAKTLTTVYTVPANTEAKVFGVLVCNRHRDPTTFRIAVAPAGAADTNAHYQWFDAVIPGGLTMPFTLGDQGITLEPTDEVRVYAYDANLSFSVHGLEVIGASQGVSQTWTPTLEAETTNPSVTYTTQTGLYIKIGGWVTIWWTILLATVSTQGSGVYQIAGLPFAFSTDIPNWQPIGSHDYHDGATNNAQVVRRHSGEASLLSMIYDSDGDGNSEAMSTSTETIAAGDSIAGVGTYLTDD